MTNETVTIITLIFTALVAICTLIYAILTSRLVKETRLSREFHLESHIISYLANSETTPDCVSLIVKNIGNGIARNVKFDVIKYIDYPNCMHISNDSATTI